MDRWGTQNRSALAGAYDVVTLRAVANHRARNHREQIIAAESESKVRPADEFGRLHASLAPTRETTGMEQ